jgi:hypothetical protein
MIFAIPIKLVTNSQNSTSESLYWLAIGIAPYFSGFKNAI